MSSEGSHQLNLTKSRELIAVADRLYEEYAELLETSRILRKESRQLSEESYVLRRRSTSLLWDTNA